MNYFLLVKNPFFQSPNLETMLWVLGLSSMWEKFFLVWWLQNPGEKPVCGADWFCWFPAKMCVSCSDSEREALECGRPTPEGLGGGQPCSSSVGKWEPLGQLRSPDPLRGTCQSPALVTLGARGPCAQAVKCPPWSRPSTSGGCEQEPWAQCTLSFQ